jgi:hypothetical protein
MPGPSAWQALTIHGCFSQVNASVANDGLGHIAAQLVRSTGATLVEEGEPCDLLLDTAGGETLARSASRASRSVTIADNIPRAHYLVVEPTGEQFLELARLVDMGQLQPEIDSVCLLTEAQAAFSAQHRPRPVRQVVEHRRVALTVVQACRHKAGSVVTGLHGPLAKTVIPPALSRPFAASRYVKGPSYRTPG